MGEVPDFETGISPVHLRNVRFNETSLKGSLYESANIRTDFDRLLRLWRHRKLDLEGMISRRIRIEDVNDAFRAMQAGEVIRSVIQYDG